MIRSYVLIQAAVGSSANVGQAVSAAGGVVSADVVTGPYDVIAVVESPSIDELGKLVVSNIQAVGGVTRTLTCPIVRL
jgi:DNA-binding Lrp family transcriptional regulator